MGQYTYDVAEKIFGEDMEEPVKHQAPPIKRDSGKKDCGRADLNREGVAPTSTSSWRVYQFHHDRESHEKQVQRTRADFRNLPFALDLKAYLPLAGSSAGAGVSPAGTDSPAGAVPRPGMEFTGPWPAPGP